MTELAIFDLDYTLTQRGTWGRFVARSMRGKPWAWPGLLIAAGWTQFRYRRGQVPRIAVKTAMMRRSIVGWPRERLEAMAADFVKDDIENGLDLRVVTALQDHQAKGHTVLIASAAVDRLVERYARALGADGYVATDFAWTADNRLADHFGSDNCYGPQKLVRIKQWMAEYGVAPDKVTAYSDSAADAPLLEFADKAIVVRPNKRATTYAKKMGFELWL
jgi:HAD superfamily hydrolase (TIGR01490 family)